jgi:hypothetical protein
MFASFKLDWKYFVIPVGIALSSEMVRFSVYFHNVICTLFLEQERRASS